MKIAKVLAAVSLCMLSACTVDAVDDAENESQPEAEAVGEVSAEARGCTSTALCVQGYVWSKLKCSCVADSCTTTAICTQGYYWEPATCSCRRQ